MTTNPDINKVWEICGLNKCKGKNYTMRPDISAKAALKLILNSRWSKIFLIRSHKHLFGTPRPLKYTDLGQIM